MSSAVPLPPPQSRLPPAVAFRPPKVTIRKTAAGQTATRIRYAAPPSCPYSVNRVVQRQNRLAVYDHAQRRTRIITNRRRQGRIAGRARHRAFLCKFCARLRAVFRTARKSATMTIHIRGAGRTPARIRTPFRTISTC